MLQKSLFAAQKDRAPTLVVGYPYYLIHYMFNRATRLLEVQE